MSGGRKPQKIYIAIKNNMVDRVRMGVLGGFRFLEEPSRHTDDRKAYSVKLIINKELERTLLQYASDIKVLEPESLKKKISTELRKAAVLYD